MSLIFQARRFWPTVLLFLSIAACSVTASAEPTPPTIHYGEDMCAFCGMIVSEEGHAAAYVASDNQGQVFDDIGDMVQFYLTKDEAKQVPAFFVHDYESKAWIRAETATYLLSPELHTPMHSSLVAFASSEKAEALATSLQGQLLSFDEVMQLYQEMAPMRMEEGKEDAHPSD
jgi:copper chaperone NosL